MSETLDILVALRGALDRWKLQGHDSAHRLRELKERIVSACELGPAQIAALPHADLELYFTLNDYLDDSIEEFSGK
jgi:hypothetical protein